MELREEVARDADELYDDEDIDLVNELGGPPVGVEDEEWQPSLDHKVRKREEAFLRRVEKAARRHRHAARPRSFAVRCGRIAARPRERRARSTRRSARAGPSRQSDDPSPPAEAVVLSAGARSCA